MDSPEECIGKPEVQTDYPSCGVCNRFFRCGKEAKEMVCPPERPVFDVSGKCKKAEEATCAG